MIIYSSIFRLNSKKPLASCFDLKIKNLGWSPAIWWQRPLAKGLLRVGIRRFSDFDGKICVESMSTWRFPNEDVHKTLLKCFPIDFWGFREFNLIIAEEVSDQFRINTHQWISSQIKQWIRNQQSFPMWIFSFQHHRRVIVKTIRFQTYRKWVYANLRLHRLRMDIVGNNSGKSVTNIFYLPPT